MSATPAVVQAVHRALMPQCMSIFPAIGGTRERYEEFLGEIAAAAEAAALKAEAARYRAVQGDAERMSRRLPSGTQGAIAMRHEVQHVARVANELTLRADQIEGER